MACIMEAVLEDWYAQGTSSKLFAVAAVVELAQDHGFFFSLPVRCGAYSETPKKCLEETQDVP